MYEYEVITIENLSAITQKQKFNELGQKDWQFVCATDKYAYFWRYINPMKADNEVTAIDIKALTDMVYGEYEGQF